MTMTKVLATPEGWPQVLLARSTAEVSVPDLGPDTGADLQRALALGAFEGLRRAIDEHGPEGVIAEVERANLRGRGGAGHPAAAKWRAARNTEAARRFVVANGYGADPATFTDMVLMERDPWAIIEGIAIVAYAIRATEAVIAVRAEYSEAVRRLDAAILAAEDAGFLGTDILEAGFDLSVTVRVVQGAYMLGEETVLLKALEGKRGQPEQRPPFPATRGLFGHPTVVHNVATLAAVPWIFLNGAAAFASIVSPAAPGTALVQVRGLEDEGVAEVPTGTPLREIVGLASGGGTGRTVKAVLVGGPSGGLLPADLLDTPYEFDALRAVGGHVGSGSVVVADESACVVDLARLLTRFCADEACGKTIPCRIGLARIAELAERATSGRSRPQDPELLGDLCHDVSESGLCDHERLATLPLTTGMRYFRTELDEHFLRGNCPAGVCRPIAAPASAPATTAPQRRRPLRRTDDPARRTPAADPRETR
jgi:NADH:ubiquinone oxidoreductase subunit F (NADH-binding)